jgi:tRNA pseudouridine38-40 synthase
MPRYKLTIEYFGKPYCGWQRQENGHSVQGVIEAAFKAFAKEDVTLYGAGRTDAGVHALGQVAHCSFSRDWEAETVQRALNALLKDERISILDCKKVSDDFDARFSAKARHYTYTIFNRREPCVYERDLVWWVSRHLDEDAMHEAAQVLVGHHDFTTFRSTRCQSRSPEKTLDKLTVERDGHKVFIHASARSFLHNQVRSLAGSLRMVGDGSWTKEKLQAALEAKDRKACGPVAPPEGLALMQVDY